MMAFGFEETGKIIIVMSRTSDWALTSLLGKGHALIILVLWHMSKAAMCFARKRTCAVKGLM